MAPASAFRKDFPHQGEIFKETDFTVIPRLNSFIWFKRTDRVGSEISIARRAVAYFAFILRRRAENALADKLNSIATSLSPSTEWRPTLAR